MSNDVSRDADLWFEDGNIVVVAQQPDTAFRVHRGVLSRHSETFSGLFTLPQPTHDPDLNETMDGCPVVRVVDSSHDMKHLLRVLYDGASYWDADEPLQPSVLAALARLGHKYELIQVFASAMKRLRRYYPTTFDQWSEAVHLRLDAINNHRKLHINSIEMFNLFYTTGDYGALPSAMLDCSSRSISSLLRGMPRADGTVERLSEHHLELALKTKVRFVEERVRFVELDLRQFKPPASCPTRNACESFGDAIHRHLQVKNLMILLAAVVAVVGGASGNGCAICRDALAKQSKMLAETLWNTLPKIMGLDDIVTDWPTGAAVQ